MIFDKIAEWVPHDKLLHYAAGTLVYATALYGELPFEPIYYVAIIGLLKEIYDHRKHGRFCFWDLLWTIIGGLVMMVGR